ncbi:MAG: hypothetical protein ACOC31_04165 [Bacteroidota bacterium]
MSGLLHCGRIKLALLIPVFLFHLPSTQAQVKKGSEEYHRDTLASIHDDYIMIKTNPLTVLWGAVPYSSEYRVTFESNTRMSEYLNIGVAYLGRNIILLDGYSPIQNLSALRFNGYKVHFNYRWKISRSRNLPEGLYLGPHISYAYMKITNRQLQNRNEYAFIEHLHAAMLVGYQAKLFDIFYFDIFAGLGYKNNTWGNHVQNSSRQLLQISGMNYVYENYGKFKAGFSFGVLIR